MEERSYTTQSSQNLNHAVVRSSNSGLSPIVNLYIKTFGAFIFCVAKKGNPNAALTPKNARFFGLALNSLRSSTVFTLSKNNALCENGIEKINSKQRVASLLIRREFIQCDL